MDRWHDLESLDFAAVRKLLTKRLQTPLGMVAVQELRPLPTAAAANQAMQQAVELARRLESGAPLPLQTLYEVRGWLESFLEGQHLPTIRELCDLKRLLSTAAMLRDWLQRGPEYPHLVQLGASFPLVKDLADELDQVVDASGEVHSNASAKLREIRNDIEVAEAAVRAATQRFLSDERVYKYLQNPEPSWRHGRPVFQVRQEYRGQVQGVLHDRSQSGATLFIEPTVVVEAANRLSDAKAAEHREIQVILARVCRGLRRHGGEIRAATESLSAFDLCVARSRLMSIDGLQPAEVVDDGVLDLRDARHPLLERDDALVPLDLRLGQPFSLLVVTGPNTGGKTVVLKTAGLLAAMALCGVPLPAAAGCKVPAYDGVFLDVGDEQAISQNLSTFSSHVTRISRCLAEATSRSLVLLDELGSGTDPEEGGALGYAVLEALHSRRIHAVVTTHMGKLKDFAYQHDLAENGSMAFDGESLRPLYRLELGIPGQSHALDIAGRVGLDTDLVERARELLGQRNVAMEEAIERVHKVRRSAEEQRQASARLSADLEGKEQAVSEELVSLERQRAWVAEEADSLVEEALRQGRTVWEGPLQKLENAPGTHGQQARELREALDALFRNTSMHRRRMKFLAALRRDTAVWVPRLQRRCTVKKIDRTRELVTLEVGKVRMQVPFEDVSWLQPLDAS